MSTLVIDELRTTLEQEFTVKKRREIAGIRPKLYFHDDPQTSFTITLKQGSTTLGTSTLAMNDILTTAGWTASQYHFGYLRFLFNSPVILNRELTYTIELSASGYTFSEASYLGWIKEYDSPVNDFDASTVDSDLERPFSMQLWSHI